VTVVISACGGGRRRRPGASGRVSGTNSASKANDQAEETILEGISEVRRMVLDCVENGRHHLDAYRCEALREASDRGDLLAVHDLLVASMIELRGISYTLGLLKEEDARVSDQLRGQTVH